MATTANKQFCDNLRLFYQYWERKNSDEIVGYCRKNMLKPAKLRKKEIYRCLKNKIELHEPYKENFIP